MPKRPLTPCDVQIGNQLFILRTIRGTSRDELSDYLGVAYQQLQKYEKGVNRLSATTLLKLSHFFDVPITFFFETTDAKPRLAPSETSDRIAALQKFLSTKEGLDFVSSYISIPDRDAQKQIANLIKSLSSQKRDTT